MLEVEQQAIASGRSSIVVIIPALWRKAKHIQAGDRLTILMDDEKLVVKPKEKKGND